MNKFFSVGGWGAGVTASIIKFSYIKNPESDFSIKNPNLIKKNSGGWEGRGRGCG